MRDSGGVRAGGCSGSVGNDIRPMSTACECCRERVAKRRKLSANFTFTCFGEGNHDARGKGTGRVVTSLLCSYTPRTRQQVQQVSVRRMRQCIALGAPRTPPSERLTCSADPCAVSFPPASTCLVLSMSFPTEPNMQQQPQKLEPMQSTLTGTTHAPHHPEHTGPERDWSTGLCACDLGGFCISCWCPCITYGEVSVRAVALERARTAGGGRA